MGSLDRQISDMICPQKVRVGCWLSYVFQGHKDDEVLYLHRVSGWET